jgi:hypothetical protein
MISSDERYDDRCLSAYAGAPIAVRNKRSLPSVDDIETVTATGIIIAGEERKRDQQ